LAIKDIHYNAFISYRHAEQDSEAAIALHRRLEAFRLPGNLRKKYPKERWKIERVFRDQDELPLSDSLSDQIEQALANADYLIVICSPRLPESKWCAREIELFKKMHGLDHILAVLIEGEPEESFPEGIRYREIPTVNEKGETVIVRQEVEPLAAELRAEDKKTRKKLLEDAVLRMAAPMYGLAYDELKQRHREQKIRRIAAISGIAAAVVLGYAAMSTLFALRISEQKKTIEEQHEQLQEQYMQQQVKYAESMAVVSDTLLKEGRRLDALYAARNSMPASKEEDDIPYTAAAEYALSAALMPYDYDIFIPQEPLPLPEDEDFWGDIDDYRDLQEYLGGHYIMGVSEREDGSVWIILENASISIYYPEERILLQPGESFYTDAPDVKLNCAVVYDDKLYMQFTDGDYMACYQWEEHDKGDECGVLTRDEFTDHHMHMIETGQEALSDDGQYIVRVESNHTIGIYEAGTKEPVQKIYDIHAEIYGLERLKGMPYYVLITSSRYSYLLNEDFECISRIPSYYGYDEKDGQLILYELASDHVNYILYKVPLKSYDELIEEADELLKDYRPSDEILTRYRMLE